MLLPAGRQRGFLWVVVCGNKYMDVQIVIGGVMMDATTRPASPPPLLSLAGFKRFTPEQYHALIHSGILQEGEPVELLEG